MRILTALFVLAAVPAFAQSTPPPDSLVTVTGRVLDADTGAPVVGAGVMLTGLEKGTVSQRDGSFVIEGVAPGTHAVRIGAFRYHMVTVDLEVDAETPLALTLEPGAGVGCAVVHEHGDDGSHMEPTSNG